MANADQLAILKQGVKVWNEWREGTPDKKIDLEDADLSKMVLVGADLFKANLSNTILDGANLKKANLIGANLSGASIVSAYFQQANLQTADVRDVHFNKTQLNAASLRAVISINTDFSDAVLAGTDFSFTILEATKFNRAYLGDAIFRGAQLINVDLSDSTLGDTIFADTDLSGAKGFESIGYSGPCTIGVDTLFRTKKRLPDVFLRGCGVPQILIESLADMREVADEFYSCFISYSFDDEVFATKLFNTLKGRGINCWKASEQILPGNRIAREIDRGISGWDKLILCCSRSSLTQKWWVDFEVEKAFAKERHLEAERGQKIDVVTPLNLDGFLLSSDFKDERKSELSARFAADFTGWEHDNAIFEREIERVIKALRTNGGKEPPPKPKL